MGCFGYEATKDYDRNEVPDTMTIEVPPFFWKI